MCSDSYPIPILSLFFLYHPYIPYFLIQRIFHFLIGITIQLGPSTKPYLSGQITSTIVHLVTVYACMQLKKERD